MKAQLPHLKMMNATSEIAAKIAVSRSVREKRRALLEALRGEDLSGCPSCTEECTTETCPIILGRGGNSVDDVLRTFSAMLADADQFIERKKLQLSLLQGEDLRECRTCTAKCEPDTCPIILRRGLVRLPEPISVCSVVRRDQHGQ